MEKQLRDINFFFNEYINKMENEKENNSLRVVKLRQYLSEITKSWKEKNKIKRLDSFDIFSLPKAKIKYEMMRSMSFHCEIMDSNQKYLNDKLKLRNFWQKNLEVIKQCDFPLNEIKGVKNEILQETELSEEDRSIPNVMNQEPFGFSDGKLIPENIIYENYDRLSFEICKSFSSEKNHSKNKTELEKQKKGLEKVEKEKEELSHKLLKLTSENKFYQREIENLKNQVIDITNDLQKKEFDLCEEIKKLKKNNSALNRDNIELKRYLAELLAKEDEKKKQFKSIVREKENISIKVNELISKDKEMRESICRQSMIVEKETPVNKNLQIVFNKLISQIRNVKLEIISINKFEYLGDKNTFQDMALKEVIESKNIINNHFKYSLEINSMISLVDGKGWKTESNFPKDSSATSNKQLRIGFLGETQSGKTNLINHLFLTKLPETPTTSIDFIQLKKTQEIVILDTPGLRSPIQADNFNETTIENDSKNRDYLITQFVLDFSNIVFYCVNQHTRITQKQINKIRQECFARNTKLYIVHNMPTITSEDKLEEFATRYIDERERFLFIYNLISEKTIEEKEIVHFILGHNSFNNKIIERITTYIQLALMSDKIVINDVITKTLIKNARTIFNLAHDITVPDVSFKSSCIKLNIPLSEQHCELSKYDFFSYWKYSESLIPCYSYYLVREDYLVVEFEMVQCIDFKYHLKPVHDYYELKLYATKVVKNDNPFLFTSRKSGPIVLCIRIPTSHGCLKTKIHNMENKNGLYSLFFELVK